MHSIKKEMEKKLFAPFKELLMSYTSRDLILTLPSFATPRPIVLWLALSLWPKRAYVAGKDTWKSSGLRRSVGQK